jgi:hypothetical protein
VVPAFVESREVVLRLLVDPLVVLLRVDPLLAAMEGVVVDALWSSGMQS